MRKTCVTPGKLVFSGVGRTCQGALFGAAVADVVAGVRCGVCPVQIVEAVQLFLHDCFFTTNT